MCICQREEMPELPESFPLRCFFLATCRDCSGLISQDRFKVPHVPEDMSPLETIPRCLLFLHLLLIFHNRVSGSFNVFVFGRALNVNKGACLGEPRYHRGVEFNLTITPFYFDFPHTTHHPL